MNGGAVPGTSFPCTSIGAVKLPSANIWVMWWIGANVNQPAVVVKFKMMGSLVV